MSSTIAVSPFATPNEVSGPAIALPPGRVIELAYNSPQTEEVTEGLYHTADTDRNYRISLTELQRVIQLYNTRYGTIRTGAYKVDESSIDGFAPDPDRPNMPIVPLSKYHDADFNQDGKISLSELTRVIELYNYSYNGVRTGQYHVDQSTEDGFATGPG